MWQIKSQIFRGKRQHLFVFYLRKFRDSITNVHQFYTNHFVSLKTLSFFVLVYAVSNLISSPPKYYQLLILFYNSRLPIQVHVVSDFWTIFKSIIIKFFLEPPNLSNLFWTNLELQLKSKELSGNTKRVKKVFKVQKRW